MDAVATIIERSEKFYVVRVQNQHDLVLEVNAENDEEAKAKALYVYNLKMQNVR